MKRVGLWAAAVIVALLFTLPARAAEQAPKQKGLFVTPAREYITAAPGEPQQKHLTLANYTASTITITLSVEQFSVADYTYDFTFKPTTEDWLHIATPTVQLEPNKNQTITYTLAPPPGATPGGHYFTVLATATIQKGAVKSQVQAATVVYATVQGDVNTNSTIQKTSIGQVSFGGDIPFTLEVKNTGNTHFFAYVSGEMGGQKSAESTHLLMPNTTRTVGASIPGPLLPGLYNAIYGYKTDAGEHITRTAWVLYLPLWSLFVLAGLSGCIAFVIRRWLRHKKN